MLFALRLLCRLSSFAILQDLCCLLTSLIYMLYVALLNFVYIDMLCQIGCNSCQSFLCHVTFVVIWASPIFWLRLPFYALSCILFSGFLIAFVFHVIYLTFCLASPFIHALPLFSSFLELFLGCGASLYLSLLPIILQSCNQAFLFPFRFACCLAFGLLLSTILFMQFF